MSAPPPPYGEPGPAGPADRAAQPGAQPPPPGWAPAPPARQGKILWWVLGGGLLGLLGLCACVGVIGVGALGGGVFALVQATAGPRAATDAYFEAVVGGDYATAHRYLSAAQRASLTPQDLARLRRGLNSYSVDNVNITSTNGMTSATATVTSSSTGGASNRETITLVKEGGDWKLATP